MNKVNDEWFDSWFDSTYYHTLYQHRSFEEAEQFLRQLVSFLNVDQSASILDLCCGKGRHSIFLNKAGFQVTGVDLSTNSIAWAKQFANSRLDFFVHDMRQPVGQLFDYVFNLFTSFGYFDSHEENERVMKAMHDSLHPEGTLVIDFLNAQKVIDNLVPYTEQQLDGILFRISKEVVGRNVVKTIEFEDQGQAFQFHERVELIQLEDFERYLNATGLRLFHTFGNYHLKPFDKETSDRLILVAKKKH